MTISIFIVIFNPRVNLFIEILEKDPKVAHDWSALTKLSGNKEILVSEITVKESGITIGGEFELPPLARLPFEDQVFVAMFVKLHGSIKEMEQAFGVSYPTIKGRINKIGEKLGFVDATQMNPRDQVLEMLDRGEISAKDAIERLKR